MSDLIQREKAIECVWKPQVKPDAVIFNALKMAIQSEIEQLPTVTPESGWISVKDRLPEQKELQGIETDGTPYTYLESDPVLVLSEYCEMTIAQYTKDNGRSYWIEMTPISYREIGDQITHWMPLPDLPEEDQ